MICPWALKDEFLKAYHDEEWCRPHHDDTYLFEMLVLEGAQAGLSRDLRYALRLAEMYPLQGLLLTEEKMKVYGKAVSPFYAMLHYEGLPDAVEIFFEEYVNEAFFFHKKGEKETALVLLGCFLYARGKYQVEKAADIAKDQSYMMYHLTQDQLAHILFPLGRMYKKDTRRISEEKGLPTYNKAESQDICFLTSEKSYAEFLQNHAPEAFRPGNIIDTKGRILGRHKGLPFYTIGQRKGLGIAARTPLYVVSLHAGKNRVIVGSNDDLFRSGLLANELDFTDGTPPSQQFRCLAKIRYGIRVYDCTVTLDDHGRAVVKFDEPQRAITPGQSVVFYEEDRLLGGGTIMKAL